MDLLQYAICLNLAISVILSVILTLFLLSYSLFSINLFMCIFIGFIAVISKNVNEWV